MCAGQEIVLEPMFEDEFLDEPWASTKPTYHTYDPTLGSKSSPDEDNIDKQIQKDNRKK